MPGRGEDATDEDILRTFLQNEEPAYFADELADTLPINKNQTNRRLKKLEDQGFVRSKQRGTFKFWWITEEGREYLQEQS